MRNKSGWILLIAAVAAFGLIGQAISQEAQPGTQDARGGRGQRGQRGVPRNAEQFRQQMAERMKAELGASDEEWKVLEPKIDKVQTLARQARGGMGMMGARMGGRRGPQGDEQGADNAPPPQTELERKGAELQRVLQDKAATPDQVKTALASYRETRAKAREELEKAQKELKEILTVRQEAVLVSWGMID